MNTVMNPDYQEKELAETGESQPMGSASGDDKRYTTTATHKIIEMSHESCSIRYHEDNRIGVSINN